ncbi:nucleotide-diphospho-sugar transferase [Fragilaria crotonensis]|nr:nucleotide-diphospho-sugar transferase [Fragilaria crotonensis]
MAAPRSSSYPNGFASQPLPLRKQSVPVQVMLLFVISCLGSFYVGLTLGMSHSSQLGCPRNDGFRTSTAKTTTATTTTGTSSFFSAVTGYSKYITSGSRFGAPMEKLIAGAARISRDRFLERFDLGVPLDPTTPGNEDALILYHHQQSLPHRSKVDAAREGQIPLLSVEDATVNCDTLKIILTEPNKPRQCLAIVGQWESYHIHKYMRLPPDNIRTGVDKTLPLRNVARTHSANKGNMQVIPQPFNVDAYDQKVLVPYLSNLKSTLAKLKPIAAKVARDKTIVVLVCNLGQSELLMNFICSSKARGFDLSNVLVFATDLETQKIAEALGVATFYDSVIFARMSEKAAAKYGDAKFAGMMMAKVFCVHLLSQLGYNILFQDADVVWYRNPVDFFLQLSDDFDMYFQDDGGRSGRYATYSPNTGFYFVRAVERTRYLFNCFVKLGDLIQQSHSHQASLTSLLNEHASYRGLRVKVFSRDTDTFPGGFHYHRDKAYMKKVIAKTISPYIFHMSWTESKEDKRKFFQQMGDWYVARNAWARRLVTCPSMLVRGVAPSRHLWSVIT